MVSVFGNKSITTTTSTISNDILGKTYVKATDLSSGSKNVNLNDIVCNNITANGTLTRLNTIDTEIRDGIVVLGKGNTNTSSLQGVIGELNNGGTYTYSGLVVERANGNTHLMRNVADITSGTVSGTTNHATLVCDSVNIINPNGNINTPSLTSSATTASTSTDTGAIKTLGGLGVAGNINVGGNIVAPTITASTRLNIAKDSRRGISASYNDSIGDCYGIEQVPGTVTNSGQAELRLYTGNSIYPFRIAFGKYTTTTDFTDFLSMNGNVVNIKVPQTSLELNPNRDFKKSFIKRINGRTGWADEFIINLGPTSQHFAMMTIEARLMGESYIGGVGQCVGKFYISRVGTSTYVGTLGTLDTFAINDTTFVVNNALAPGLQIVKVSDTDIRLQVKSHNGTAALYGTLYADFYGANGGTIDTINWTVTPT